MPTKQCNPKSVIFKLDIYCIVIWKHLECGHIEMDLEYILKNTKKTQRTFINFFVYLKVRNTTTEIQNVTKKNSEQNSNVRRNVEWSV